MMWLVGMVSVSWAAPPDCLEDSSSLALSSAAMVELAYATVDEQRLIDAASELDAQLRCVAVELTAADALAIHRAKAISSFVAGDIPATERSWAAVRALDPSWRPSDALMPVGHPLRGAWESSAGLTVNERELAMSPVGGFSVDGAGRGLARVPDGRNYILQGFGADGSVIYTGYAASFADAPELPDMIPTRKVRLEAKDPKRGARIRLWGSIGAGALAIGSATCFGLAADAWSRSKDPETSVGERIQLATRVNTLSGVGTGLAIAAVGTGVLVWTVTW